MFWKCSQALIPRWPIPVVWTTPAGTALVSVMLANNEVGTIQPIRQIANRAHTAGALMHVDAAQAAGKIAVDVDALGADLLTLAGHKMYAPKGVGALYVRAGTPLQAIQFGAGHERRLRPGTENVPHIVALGEAARLARTGLEAEAARVRRLRDALHQRLVEAIPGLALNGHETARLPNTLNVSFPGMTGWRMLATATAVAASTGSACHAGQQAASGVLGAMGLSAERAAGALSAAWVALT
jgi:cysteine desulfurase